MDKREKVSVIIPVYNSEKYIRRTLEAVCGQTYDNLEAIVVNDGSTDNTGEICQSYAKQDQRIQYYVQENAGVGAARNRGMDLAASEYLMFLDADDWIDPDFVEKMAVPLMDGDADFSVCDIDNIDTATDAHTLSIIRLPYGVTETKTDRNVISKIRTFCWGKVYRKRLWTDNGIRFPEGEIYRTLPGFEDICCLPLVAAHAEKLIHVKDAPYHYYRGHENSLMHEARFSFFLNSLPETMRRFQDSGLEAKFHDSLRKFMLGQLVSANRWELSVEEIRKLWDFTDTFFPEIAEAKNYFIYVPKGSRHDILKHVFFDRTKFTDERKAGETSVLEIELPDQIPADIENYETYCYDMADRVIDRLPDILREYGRKQ